MRTHELPLDTPLFQSGDGIDVYVDGARYLPESVTVTQTVVKAYTADLKKVGSDASAACKLDSEFRSPEFG